MGGRIAEELVFGRQKITTGASSDIRMATALARRMVTEWGMSESLGPVFYGDAQPEVFLGRLWKRWWVWLVVLVVVAAAAFAVRGRQAAMAV